MSKEKKPTAPPDTAMEIQRPISESGKENKETIPKLQINLNLPTRDLGATVDVVLNLEAGKKPMQTNYRSTSSHTEFYGECPIPGEGTISKTTLARIKADNGTHVIPVKVSWMSGQASKSSGALGSPDRKTKDAYRPGSIMPLVHEMYLARRRITPLIQNIIDTGIKRVLEKKQQEALEENRSAQSGPNAEDSASDTSSVKVISQRQSKRDRNRPSTCRQGKCTISIRKSNTKDTEATQSKGNVSKPRVSLTYTARVGVLRMNGITETYNKIKPESNTNSGINLPPREQYSMLFLDPKRDIKTFSKSISSSKTTNSSFDTVDTDNKDSPLSNLKAYGKDSPPHPFEEVRNILRNFTKVVNDSNNQMDTKSCNDLMSDNISDMISSTRSFKRMKTKGAPDYNPLKNDSKGSFSKFSDILSNFASKHSSKSFYDDIVMGCSDKIISDSLQNDLERSSKTSKTSKTSRSNPTVSTPIPSIAEEIRGSVKGETLKDSIETEIKFPSDGDLINQMIHLRDMLDTAINGIWKEKNKPQGPAPATEEPEGSAKSERTQWSISKEISKTVYKDLYERAKCLKSSAEDVISSHEMIFREESESTDIVSRSRSSITLGRTLSTTLTDISGVKDKILGCLAELLEVKRYLDNCTSAQNKNLAKDILRSHGNEEASSDSSSTKKPVIRGSLGGIPVLFTMNTEDRKTSTKDKLDPPDVGMPTPCLSLSSSNTSLGSLRNRKPKDDDTDVLSEGNMEELPNSTSENETMWKCPPLSSDPERKKYRQSTSNKRRLHAMNKTQVEASSSSEPIGPVEVTKTSVAVDGYRKSPDAVSKIRSTDEPKNEEHKEVQFTKDLNNSRIKNALRLQNNKSAPVEVIAVVEDHHSKETSEISSQEQSSIEKHSDNGDLSVPYSDEDDDSPNRHVHYSDGYKADSLTGDENLSTESSMVNLKLALQSLIPQCESPTQSREDIISDEDYARNTMHLEALAVKSTEATLTKRKTSSGDLDGLKYSDEEGNLKDDISYARAESMHSLPNLIEETKGAVSQVTSDMSSSSCTSTHSFQQPYIMNWPISSSQSSKRSIVGDSVRNAEVMFLSQDRKLHFESKSLRFEGFPNLAHELKGKPSTPPSNNNNNNNNNQAVRYIALPSDKGVTYVALPPDQAVTYVTLPPDQNNDVLSYPVISDKGKDDGEYKGVVLVGNEVPSLISQQRSNVPSVTSDISNSIHEATAPYFPPKNYVVIKEIGSETKNVCPHSSCPTCGREMQSPAQETTVFQTQIDLRRLSRLLEEEEEASSGSKEPPVTPPMFEEEPLEINEESFTLLYKPSATSLPECCSQSDDCDKKSAPHIHKQGSHISRRSTSSGEREISKSENNVPEVYRKKDRNASDSFERNREEHKQIVSERTSEGKAMSSKRRHRAYTGDSNPHVLPYSPSVSSLPLDIEFSEEVSESGAELQTSPSLRSKGIEKSSMGDAFPGTSNDISLLSETPKEDKSERECECKPLNQKINIGFFAKTTTSKSSTPIPEYQVNRINIIHGLRKSAHDTNQYSYSPSTITTTTTRSSSTENDQKYNQEQATKQKRGLQSLAENIFIKKSFDKAPVDKRISNKPKAEIRMSKSGTDLKQKLKKNSSHLDSKHHTTVKSEKIISSDDDNNPYYPSTNSLPPQEFDKNYLVSTRDKNNDEQHGRVTSMNFEFSEKKSHVVRTADNSSSIRETDAKITSTREENDGSKHRRNKSHESQHTMSSFYTSSDSSSNRNLSCSTEHVSKLPRNAIVIKEHCGLPESTTNDKRHQRSEETFATPQRDEKEDVHRRRRETSSSKDSRVRGTNEMKCSKPGPDSSRKQTDKKGSQELHEPADFKHSSRRRTNEAKIKETQLQLANVQSSDLPYTDKVRQKLSSHNQAHFENKRLKYEKHSPLSQRLVTLTIRSPPENLDYDLSSSWEDRVRVGKDSKKTKENRGNKHSYKSINSDSENDTESLAQSTRSKLAEATIEDDISTVNTCGRKSSTSQVLWALARVSVFDDGTKTLEVLHALPTPPRHYLLTDLGDVTVVRNEKYKTK